ncbi:TRAP transporter substrate-binding protein [Algihabitans albus]|uniref:TRAP transporter substrate-binding protein n=1 Tax=Algihabitans albus TaxID=2164067 RepID=UPI000E5C84FE|nr:TRAP transporter substrate-binding protein [Algihabitans albus]
MRKTLRVAQAATLTVGLMAGLAVGPALAETWDLPTPYPEGNFHTQNIMRFAEEVNAAAGDDLEVVVHPAGSLIKHPEIKNAVRSGQVPVGEFLLSRLSNENPVFGADSVPFLANSYDAAERLWDASREVTEALLARQNLMILFVVPWPPQGIYADGEVATLDDMSGLKFRTYNAATERLAQLAGAVPTQVEVPDISQAFATGRVEAMITSPSTGVNIKAWDFLSHYYDTQAWLPKNVTVVNVDAFEALSPELQEAVKTAAAAAEQRGWEASRNETAEKTQILLDNGIAVADPSESLAASLREIGATMADEWAEQAGDDGAAILENYRN